MTSSLFLFICLESMIVCFVLANPVINSSGAREANLSICLWSWSVFYISDISDISVDKIIYRILGDISRYGTKYQTSFRTSYTMKNMHVIAYINPMKLLKASLCHKLIGDTFYRSSSNAFVEAPQMRHLTISDIFISDIGRYIGDVVIYRPISVQNDIR